MSGEVLVEPADQGCCRWRPEVSTPRRRQLRPAAAVPGRAVAGQVHAPGDRLGVPDHDLLVDHGPEERDGPEQGPVHRRDGVLLRPQHHRPRHPRSTTSALLPLLIALFSFILVNNLWGIFPLTLLPTTAHVGWAYGLAGLVWVIYNGVGIASTAWRLSQTHPAGRRAVVMWWLIIPLEFISNIIVRPVTLSLRLFANMFAGHLLVLVFVIGGEYLLFESEPIVNKVAGAVALVFSMAIFGLEIFVQCLQAFIFTVLTAQYISSAIAEEH